MIAPDFCEGLKRMLSAVYAHTSKNVLSSTMAWKILYQGTRFKFSHKTEPIPLPHLIEWVEGADNLDFRLRKIKKKMTQLIQLLICSSIILSSDHLS